MSLGPKLLMLLLAVVTTARGTEVHSSGDWIESIDASDLTGGAGTTLVSTVESVSAVTSIDVVNSAGGNWRLLVRCSDPAWSDKIVLRIRRTSNGSGTGIVDGGLVYSEITAFDTEICTGTGDRTGLTFQLQATGMSLEVDPGIHQAPLVYTVINL